VRSLNSLNDGRATAAQQKLESRRAAIPDRSDSSVEFIAEAEGNPERERREKPVVRSTPPVVDSVVTPAGQAAEAHVDVLDEAGQVRGCLRTQAGEYEEKAIGAEFSTACAIGFIDPRVYQPGRTREKP
jgi:uncharacterized protein (DUF3084 family)